MIAGEGIQHIGIPHFEGQGIAGFPLFSGVGDIHNGVVRAAADDLHALVQRNEGLGVRNILTAQCQNGPHSASLIHLLHHLASPVFGGLALGGRGFFVDLHDLGGK